jgi:hypothetical protein
LIRFFIISAIVFINVLKTWNSKTCQTSCDIVRVFINDEISKRIKSFSMKFQKNAVFRLKSISKRSSFFRFNNSFFICILWIRSNFNRAFFVSSENFEMKNSTNWSMKFLKYFFFLMMFFLHETSSFDLKWSETQISLNLIFWFFRL